MVNVLIIDDEAPMRRLIARLLTKQGHAVREASNGREGLKLFRELQPSLVISDIVMPDSEGLETIKQIRKLAPTIPILAISGSSQQLLYLRAATGFGASASLEKPFDPQQLVAVVEDLLAGG